MDKARAVLYHFTNKSEKRPLVYKKEVQRLREFAELMGYPDPDEYIDKSLKKLERSQFDMMMGKIENYEAIIMKDFYHISRNTRACMSNCCVTTMLYHNSFR